MYVTNVVGSCRLILPKNGLINLKKLTYLLVNVKYNPNKWNCIIWQHRKIKKICLVYSTGIIHILGCKSIKQMKRKIRQYARLLCKYLNYPLKLQYIRTTTMCITHELLMSFNFMHIVRSLDASYEPEIFIGAKMKLLNRMSVTIYQSGKINIVGLKSVKDLKYVRSWLVDIYRKYSV